MSNDAEALRTALAEADRLSRFSRAAEHARVLIRLGHTVEKRKGILGFWKSRELEPFTFSQAETDAIYDALSVTSNEYRKQADEAYAKLPVYKPSLK